MKVFVYGTLKYLQPNHHFLRGRSDLIASNVRIPGLKLYDLGVFPAAIMSREPSDAIYGEVYELHDDKQEYTLASLDRLEGHPTFYERQIRQATDENGVHHDVYVYVFLQSVQGYKLLPDGRWGERKVVKPNGGTSESQSKQVEAG
jgi:gamma-glutamylcyclotransferase (GGCT)/AIG2-like uncharacterized protein YtfP